MRHLESVTPLGNGRSHWIAKGLLAMRVEWDAEIINEEENRVIGWRSLEHADVVSVPEPISANGGMRDRDRGAAAVFAAEGTHGRVGRAAVRRRAVAADQDDLHRVKECLETGAGASAREHGEVGEPEPEPERGRGRRNGRGGE